MLVPFGELRSMEGSAKIISLIAPGTKNQHLVLTQQILNKWKNDDDPDMKEIAKEEQENVINMFKHAVEEEKEWSSIPIQRW